MPALPSGTVTFLFTDMAGSTRLLQRVGERYAELLAAHHRLLRAAFQAHGGREVDTQGEAFFVAFPRAVDAVAAAVAAQRAFAAHPWPEGAPVRVRMGLHTGEPRGVAWVCWLPWSSALRSGASLAAICWVQVSLVGGQRSP